jgi:phosphoribosylanthranilate isomerase
MKVKICGITRSEDVSQCEESGANFLGFINIKRSKRNVDIPKIKELVSTMKNKKKAVLVLEPNNIEEVIYKMKKTGIRTIQLHSLSPSEIKYLNWIEGFQRTPFEENIMIIRTVGISEDSVDLMNKNEIRFSKEKIEEIEDFAKTCDAILFDYQVKGKSGGTGKQIPLKLVLEAVKTAKKSNNNLKIFLAGGINSEHIRNEKKVLEMILDYVDVNSGVEDEPGIKNHDRVDKLMEIRV